MNIEFLVKVGNTTYDVSELVTKISYKDALNDGCSKLEFSYLDDLVIENGSPVSFKYSGVSIFFGYVFIVSRNKGKEISVTAYDQLRYCKAKDSIVLENDTITTLTRKMCHYFKLKMGTLTDTQYVLAPIIHDDKTWLDIIYTAVSDTLLNKGKKYALRDEFGSVAIRDLEELNLNLVLGDKSLCYDFEYGKTIDDEFYNRVKIFIKGDGTKDSVSVEENDTNSVSKYGLLQYFEAVEGKTNISQAKAKAKMLLNLYNRETETLSLECLGDTSIRAGTSFYGYISDIELNSRLIVRSVTHDFLPIHTMSLEVMV